MSKKNNRPYHPVNWEKEKERISQNTSFNQNPLGNANLMEVIIQLVVGAVLSLGWFIYQAYQFGFAQASLVKTAWFMVLSTALFLIIVIVGGFSFGYVFSSQGKRWGKLLLPLSLIIWVIITYFINNYALS